jgi:hypothetical protein
MTEAFDADSGLRCLIDQDPASPNSTRRRIASDRDGWSGCSAAHLSTFARSSGASRTPMTDERPVAGLSRFFRRRSGINWPFGDSDARRDALAAVAHAPSSARWAQGHEIGAGGSAPFAKGTRWSSRAPHGGGGNICCRWFFKLLEQCSETCREGLFDSGVLCSEPFPDRQEPRPSVLRQEPTAAGQRHRHPYSSYQARIEPIAKTGAIAARARFPSPDLRTQLPTHQHVSGSRLFRGL